MQQTHASQAYRLNINPIVLKELLIDCGIGQGTIAS